MKKLFVIFWIILSATNFVNAQTSVYHPFANSTYWRVDYDSYYPVQFPCHYKYYYHYYISGDTVINSMIHKKINRSFMAIQVLEWNPTTPGAPPPTSGPGGYAGALRDDSSANKTWFVFPNTTTDSLLFDYNLTVGDSVKGCTVPWPAFMHVVVSAVDSVLIKGHFRKRWIFDSCMTSMGGNLFSLYVIEGIGSSRGLIEPLCTYAIDFANRYLVCVKDSSGTVFTSAYIPYNSPFSCNPIIAGIPEVSSENTIEIYPNPFSTQTSLHSGKVLHKATLTLYNSFGQRVKQIENISGQSITLQRDNLGSGMYLVRLVQDNKVLLSHKILITGH
jgi:hypothetical protein